MKQYNCREGACDIGSGMTITVTTLSPLAPILVEIVTALDSLYCLLAVWCLDVQAIVFASSTSSVALLGSIDCPKGMQNDEKEESAGMWSWADPSRVSFNL